MSRSLLTTTLATYLAWVGLAQGQTAKPEAPPLESRIWKKITIVEANRPAEQCVITKVWRTAEGTPVMLARSLANTSTRMTIVEDGVSGKGSYRVFRWSDDGVPPTGSPLPPDFASLPKMTTGVSVVRAAGPEGENKPPMPPAAPEKPGYLPAGTHVKELPAAPKVETTPAVETKKIDSKPAVSETKSAASIPTPEGVIGQVITVREPGKAEQKCKIEEIYLTGEGDRVLKVKSVETGEIISLVESRQTGSTPSGPQRSRFRIVRNSAKNVETVQAVAAPATPVVAQTSSQAPTTTTANPTTSLLPPDAPVSPVTTESTAAAPAAAPSQPLVNIAGKADWKKSWGTSSEPAATTGRIVNRKQAVEPPAPIANQAVQAQAIKGDLKPPTETKVEAPVAKENTPTGTEPRPFEDKVISSKVIDEREVETPAGDANRLSVPVPLVPLVTSQVNPNVPPPQPPARPFNTMESNAVIRTDIPKGNTAIESVSQQVTTIRGPMSNQGPTLPLQTNPLVANGGPVNPSLWSRGPVAPVTNLPIMNRTAMNVGDLEALALQNTVFLMTVLQSSGEPAQREWAAQRLRVVNDKTYGFVIEALVTAAKSDHAPLVRSSAVQSLAAIGCRESHVLAVLEDAANDRDPRVRDEANVALETLKDKPAAMKQPAVMTVQPAGR